MTLDRRKFTLGAAAMAGMSGIDFTGASAIASGLTTDDIRAIARDAYVYGFPMIDAYRICWAYFVDMAGKEYKGPINDLHSAANVFTPADTAVQTPNSDTPYSFAWIDLRTEPIVLTLPAIEHDRYYSVQLVDLYTFNFGYLGTRTTGNGGGHFLLAGPDWEGDAPDGITSVLRCETEFALAIYRTQLLKPDDIEKVRGIQSAYGLKPLSAFAGRAAPAAAPVLAFPTPLAAEAERTSLEGFNLLSFLLDLSPVVASEVDLRERFASIGIGAGLQFDPATLPADVKAAMEAGMIEGQNDIDARRAATPSSVNLFGTREFMKNDYVNRAVGAQAGILGNSKEEAFYGLYDKASNGSPLTGANAYVIRFAEGQLPPAKAFWSFTMYDLPQQLLVANPIDRYLINSGMLPAMRRDTDGGVTIHVGNLSPGTGMEANWLPAPQGPFMIVMRIYLPEPSVLDGAWKQPQVDAAS